ncbi:hypothetical protein Tco_1276010 [Tanacetum coccineum]
MVLQLTDFTSEITDEELREFTSEYYIPSALHPVVPAADASIADFPVGKVGRWIVQRGTFSKPSKELRGCPFMRMVRSRCWKGHTGRTLVLVLGNRKIESTDLLAPHLSACAKCNCGASMPDQQAWLFRGLTDVVKVDSGNPSGASPTLAAKEETETPPPNVEAISDSSAPVTHAAQSPPQTGPKAFDGKPVDQLVEEFDTVTAQQAALVAQLRAWFANERSQSTQKDEEILLLKAQLVDAQAEAESSRSYAQHLARENGTAWVKVEKKRADAAEYKASCHGPVKEDKLRKLSIEYDEELYPHMLSTIAERRWLISHGLRLAAMSTLESQEVRQSFGDVGEVPGYNQKAYEELVAAMEAMKLLELPHIAQLERDQDYPIGVIMTGLTLARHATEGAEAQPDYFLKPDVSQLQVPIFASPRDILNPFALEKESLKESLGSPRQ